MMPFAALVHGARFGALVLGAVSAALYTWIGSLPASELPLWLLLTGFLVLFAVPLLYLLLFRLARRWTRVTFVVGAGEFRLPRGVPWFGAVFVLQAPIVANLIVQPELDSLALRVVAVLVVPLMVWALFRSGPLRLTPDGLRISPRHRVVWDVLEPGGPYPEHVQGRTIWLLTRYDGWKSITVHDELVDVEFLAAAIRHYRENPAARAGIGTRAGLDALAGA